MTLPNKKSFLQSSMLKTPVKRRRFLRGLLSGGLVTVGLPWLELFAGRNARAESGFPSRFLLFFWGNGCIFITFVCCFSYDGSSRLIFL